MGRLTFSHLAVLGGLAALAIPVIIHLLFRHRKRPLRFSTLQFFLQQEERATRRQKLRHWLLLLVRCALVALLVFAFARPYLREPGPAGAPIRRDVVIVLDRSASMQAGGHWAAAKAQAAKIVGDLAPEDRVAMVDAADPAPVLAPLSPPQKVKDLLRELQPSFGAGNIARGMTEGARLLGQNAPGRVSSLIVISDWQRSGAAGLTGVTVPKRIELRLVTVEESSPPNLALTGLTFEAGALQVKAAGFGAGVPSVVNAALDLDGQPVTNFQVRLASQPGRHEFALPVLTPGWHLIEGRLVPESAPPRSREKGDALAADNHRCLALKVPEPLRVLVAEPRPSARPFEEESFFLMSALAAASTNRLPVRCEKVPAVRLVSALAAAPRDTLLILPGLQRVPESLGAELQRLVTGGGGALLFLGESVVPARYHSEFGALLPASLRRIEGQPDKPEEFWHVGDFDAASPAFAAFRNENSGDPTRPVFKRRFALQVADGAEIVARFADGGPFIVARKSGEGRIVLMNTSADTAWTDWPKRKTFVPWFQGLIALATGRPLQSEIMTGTAIVCGTEEELELNSKDGVRVRGPAGEIPVQLRAGKIAVRPEQPGLYTITDAANHELSRFTASVPQVESDLATVNPDDFLGRIVRTEELRDGGSLAGLLGDNSRELWRFLLAGGLALLIIESLLANRTWA
jgi:hypothetical protein